MSSPADKSSTSGAKTILFMVILSFFCALILSLLASALEKPKLIAKDLDRSKQMMIAAKILSPEGYFLVEDQLGKHVPARLEGEGRLVPDQAKVIPSQEELLAVYNKRLIPILVDDKGEIKTFQSLKIDLGHYTSEFRKMGYYKQPWKLIYKILSNPAIEMPISASTSQEPGEKSGPREKSGKEAIDGYVIPVNGYGLWDAIYGYLALQRDGDTIIGITWYDQKETPGLGANISETYWQTLFDGKKIFQPGPDGKTDFKTAPLGITVLKGKVSEVLGNAPKAKSAVDGMTGATLTGNGVTDAYRDVLAAYRPFLLKLHEEEVKK